MKIKLVETHELVKTCIIDTDNLDFKDFKSKLSYYSEEDSELYEDISDWDELINEVKNGNLRLDFNEYVFNISNFEIIENWGDQENYFYIL